MTTEQLWIMIGITGQILFTGRFLVQWWSSERAGRSVIPAAFWYLSISGGLVLLTYAAWRQDPVFILGQSLGLFIYLRNLQMVLRERRPTVAEREPARVRASVSRSFSCAPDARTAFQTDRQVA